MSKDKVPTWKQLGYGSADDLSGKIGWEGGFSSFYFGYGCGVEKEYEDSEFARALRELNAAYAKVRRMLKADGVEPDGLDV